MQRKPSGLPRTCPGIGNHVGPATALCRFLHRGRRISHCSLLFVASLGRQRHLGAAGNLGNRLFVKDTLSLALWTLD